MSSILFYSTRKTQKLDRIGALKGGPFRIFQHFSHKTSKKLKGGLFGGKICFEKKVPQCRKNWKGRPFSLARYCLLREKKENLFDSVQFDTIKFRRTFKN